MSHVRFDLERVGARVDGIHNDLRSDLRRDYHADPLTVGRRAAEIARRYYRGEAAAGHELGGVNITIATCVGYLVYGMELYALDFMAVSDLTAHEVAYVVREITPDIRRAVGPRHNDFRSQIGAASPLAQIIVLAKIQVAARRLLEEVSSRELYLGYTADKRWADDQVDVVKSLNRLSTRDSMKEQFKKVNDLLTRVFVRLDQVHKNPPSVVSSYEFPDDEAAGSSTGAFACELDDADSAVAVKAITSAVA